MSGVVVEVLGLFGKVAGKSVAGLMLPNQVSYITEVALHSFLEVLLCAANVGFAGCAASAAADCKFFMAAVVAVATGCGSGLTVAW